MTQALSKQEQHQNQHRKYVLSSWSVQGATAPVIVRGEGRYFFDEDNNKYFDLASGLVSTNLGHGHPKLVKAIQDQAAKLCYSPTSYYQDTRAELAEALSKISPWSEGCRTFFTSGGAEANDDAIRLARTLTGRFKIFAAFRSYHGSTGTAVQLTGEDRRWVNGVAEAPGIKHFWTPFLYRSPFHASNEIEETSRALEHLERTLAFENPKNVAAIILETVVGSNGVIPYPKGYLQGVRKLTEQHGILLILDEVMTGFGRTGNAFAAITYGITPDLITFAKGVTSAYIPLGGVMVRENLAKTFDANALPVGHTYAGHPLCTATGLATLKIYEEENVFEHVKEMETWLRAGLTEIQSKHKHIGEVRGVGAFWALEWVKDKDTREPLVGWPNEAGLGIMKNLYAELKKREIYTFGKFNATMVTPPLTTTKEELSWALERLDDGIAAFEAGL